MPSVRGIGVAVSVSTSTSARSRFICSLWRTPKRCSSSMMTRPRRLNWTSDWISRWVPMTISMRPVGEAVEHRLDFLAGTEARQLGELHRQVGEAVGEGLEVLLGQQRGRRQHGHLLAVGERDERRAQRDLGLAEADVAADEPVHRLAGDDVLDHGLDRARLVGRFLEAETLRRKPRSRALEAERVSFARGALGVEVEQFGRGVVRAAARPCASPCPIGRCRARAAAPLRARRRCSG